MHSHTVFQALPNVFTQCIKSHRYTHTHRISGSAECTPCGSGTYSEAESATDAATCIECTTQPCGFGWYRETCGEGRVRDASCRIENGLFAVAVLAPLVTVCCVPVLLVVMRKTRRAKTFAEMSDITEEGTSQS
jgi:hypothetical protein